MARYQEIESEIEKNKKVQNDAYERYALERKYNRAKPKQLLEYIIEKPNNICPTHLLYEANKKNWDDIARLIKYSTTERNLKINLLRNIINKADNFIDNPRNINAINGIANAYSDRLRNIEDWIPKKKNTQQLLSDLLHHLFANYKVPDFLINGFICNELCSILLYIHIGTGENEKQKNMDVRKKLFFNFPQVCRLV